KKVYRHLSKNALHNLPDAKESFYENSNPYYRAFRDSLSDYSRWHDVGRHCGNGQCCIQCWWLGNTDCTDSTNPRSTGQRDRTLPRNDRSAFCGQFDFTARCKSTT